METSIQPTRWEILQILKRRGQSTVEELATTLSMTLMGVRQHLVVLERDGLVLRKSTRERLGRPALLYSLTENAEEVFPKGYDLLTATILEELGREYDQTTIGRICSAAAGNLAASLGAPAPGNDFESRLASAVCLLNDRQYYAEGEQQEATHLIHFYNCPYYRVAKHYKQICEFDRQLLSTMLEVDLALTTTLVARQGRCTFVVTRSRNE